MKTPSRATVLLLLPLLWSCTSTPPPAPPPPPSAAASLEALETDFLKKIESNARSVDSREARKGEIVANLLQDQELLREQVAGLRSEVDSKRASIDALEQRRNQRQERLTELRQSAGDEALAADLQKEVTALDEDLQRERENLQLREGKLRDAEVEAARFADLDEEALFKEYMQSVYREGIDLHLGFYRGVIEVTRQQLAGDDANNLIDHFEDRIEERSRFLSGPVEPQAFASLRREFELDQRMSQAWLAAFILEVRFSLSEASLETISEEERQELALLAEALRESWNKDQSLVMMIDGHSDTRKYRGRSDCVSATLNSDLSRRRAEAVREYFSVSLGGTGSSGNTDSRILIDWFGNFAVQEGISTDELRRIELRVTSQQETGHNSHRDYFAMLEGLELAGRKFIREPGRWVDTACPEPPTETLTYLSEEYGSLASRLGLDNTAIVPLNSGQRELRVSLGNDFVVADGETCIAVVPCEAPELTTEEKNEN